MLFLYLFFFGRIVCVRACVRVREGTGWLEQMLIKMEKGEADTREIPMLEEISRSIEGHTICALGDAAAWPVQVRIPTTFTPQYKQHSCI